jgi:hypothetical protein
MGRGVDDNFLKSKGSPPARLALDALMPAEENEYYQALAKKHFSEQSSGSRFANSVTLNGLVKENLERLLKDSDERDLFLRLGVEENALLPDRSYFLLKAPGKNGMIDSASLGKETIVYISRQKPGSLSFLVVGKELQAKTEWATAIVGDYPKDKSRKALITIFPGLPSDPQRSSVAEENEFSLRDGQQITLGDLEVLLGRDDLLLQTADSPLGP